MHSMNEASSFTGGILNSARILSVCKPNPSGNPSLKGSYLCPGILSIADTTLFVLVFTKNNSGSDPKV